MSVGLFSHKGVVVEILSSREGLNSINTRRYQFSSVQFSCSVVSDSLRPHELQHARSPCPSPTPGVHSDSRLSSQCRHLAISSSVVPFSSCSQSLPASESFPMSQLFAWGGQSAGVSALASFFPISWHDIFFHPNHKFLWNVYWEPGIVIKP